MARAATGPTTAPAIQALLEELPLPLEVEDVDEVVGAVEVDVDVALMDVVSDVEVESVEVDVAVASSLYTVFADHPSRQP